MNIIMLNGLLGQRGLLNRHWRQIFKWKSFLKRVEANVRLIDGVPVVFYNLKYIGGFYFTLLLDEGYAVDRHRCYII